MPQTKSVKSAARSSYQKLLKSIRSSVFEARHKIERTLVQMNWTVGRAIAVYSAQSNAPLPGGKTIYRQLSEDLKIDHRTLYEMVQFYKTYPRLDYSLSLSWSHYRYLSQIRDDTERRRWERRIVRGKLSVKELLILRKENNVPKSVSRKALVHRRGKLYHYRAVKINDECFADCGFDNYIRPRGLKRGLDNSRIYVSVKNEDYALRLSKAVKDDLYTYVGYVQKVVDADTLLVNVDCGFGIFHRERLRLRGIDAPEAATLAGRRAAAAVKGLIGGLPFVIVKTYKEDKYGRYLADVYYLPGQNDADRVVREGTFLNQELLDRRLAEAYTENNIIRRMSSDPKQI